MCKIDCYVKTVSKFERNFETIDKKDLQNLGPVYMEWGTPV